MCPSNPEDTAPLTNAIFGSLTAPVLDGLEQLPAPKCVDRIVGFFEHCQEQYAFSMGASSFRHQDLMTLSRCHAIALSQASPGQRTWFLDACALAIHKDIMPQAVIHLLGWLSSGIPHDFHKTLPWNNHLDLLTDIVSLLKDPELFSPAQRIVNIERTLDNIKSAWSPSHILTIVQNIAQGDHVATQPDAQASLSSHEVLKWVSSPDPRAQRAAQQWRFLLQELNVSPDALLSIHKSFRDDSAYMAIWLCQQGLADDACKRDWIWRYAWHMGSDHFTPLVSWMHEDGFLPMREFTIPPRANQLADILQVPDHYWDALTYDELGVPYETPPDVSPDVMSFGQFRSYMKDPYEIHEDLVELNDFATLLDYNADLPESLHSVFFFRPELKDAFPELSVRLSRAVLQEGLSEEEPPTALPRPRKM